MEDTRGLSVAWRQGLGWVCSGKELGKELCRQSQGYDFQEDKDLGNYEASVSALKLETEQNHP